MVLGSRLCEILFTKAWMVALVYGEMTLFLQQEGYRENGDHQDDGEET
jgi:hypothetical protein